MTQKKIIMRTKNGVIEVEAVGFVGPICKTRAEFLTRALGEEVMEDLKPVYYETEEGVEINQYKPICG